MKTVKLNLEDRVSWQKFQHVLTSFASDYIDLVAPEQTLCKLEQKTLLISFALINSNSDRTRANIFTQNLEAFLLRLPLVEVRRVELELVDLNHDETILSAGFDLPYTSASAIAPYSHRKSGAGLVLRRTFGNLVRGLRTWITSPEVQQNVQTGTKLAIRNPKTALALTANFAKDQFITAINWVDTFPWEEWVQNRVAEQKRRHKRNLFKAVIEDVIIFALLSFLVITSVDMLSAPSFNVANLPKQHYDQALDTPASRCSWSGVSKQNYVCLSRGMSYRQVVNILGGEGVPLGFAPKFGDNAVIVSWQKGDEAMNVTFREDYLVAKAYRNLS
ncbi:hypothetical protein Syn7502_02474 [Synechococcus sp. PCC 7502]|uniref:hypothetical protein n=1 Tax=Synechococcus sp. PCC 7502 TaxID=1173263 RepID=UPI00029F8CA9|nr:hypothetical protein [Synechococcus sp. PCC 7502]AFY74453.1 hypothetical protein Syn7502_02474 [Synechococcus sp. PCC 7502]